MLLPLAHGTLFPPFPRGGQGGSRPRALQLAPSRIRTEARCRRAITLLEVVMATTLLAGLGTAAALLLRTGHLAWSAHEDDAVQLEAAHATLRHIARHVRQAVQVSVISSSTDNAGSLSLLMPSGEMYVWSRNAATNEVNFGVGSASNLLASGITGLSFAGYGVDTVTVPVSVTDIQSVVCRVRVQLPHEVGGARTITQWEWLRTW